MDTKTITYNVISTETQDCKARSARLIEILQKGVMRYAQSQLESE